MKLLTAFTLMTICLTAIGQTFPTKKDRWYQVDTSFTKNDKARKTLTYYSGVHVDTESKYTDSAGRNVSIQNSLPKGGSYIDSFGKRFGYRIFWTRVINETATPLELTIHFPADSFVITPSLDSYVKVFLPPDTMTLDKEILYDYGATGLESFLDTGLHQPTMLQRTIKPGEACLFYVGALLYQATGVPRAGLVLKEQELFYRINLLDSALIPCGQIVFRN